MFATSRLAVLASCTVILAALGFGPAQAAPITFDTHPGKLDTSQIYGPITAYGFTAPTSGSNKGVLTAAHLYGKTGSGDETGLGLFSTISSNDNEINAPAGSQAIVLDVRALSGQDLRIGFGSVQSREGWRVGFSSSATLPINESAFLDYVSGTTDYPTTFDLGVKSSNYLIIEATSGNVLLTSLNATSVPEPASMVLLGSGLLSLGMISKRRIKTKV